MPAEDRWLLFDWSNRVIGFLDPDYAVSSSFDAGAGTPIARDAHALRPAPGVGSREVAHRLVGAARARGAGVVLGSLTRWRRAFTPR